MGFNPSKRPREEEGELNLNLNPMMDMFAVLIPALLMMSVVVEVAVINISAPSIGGGTPPDKQADTKPPLNLTVTILESGYQITGSLPLPGINPEDKGPHIPVIEKTIICSRYRGTRPPPRSKNNDRAKCDEKNPYDKKSFWVYDTDALTSKIMEIKEQNQEEHRIIIAGGAAVEYEPVVDAIDATRDIKEASGDIRVLFDEVVVSPGM